MQNFMPFVGVFLLVQCSNSTPQTPPERPHLTLGLGR